MTERMAWFRCRPSALLGALAGMSPECGYVYTVLLMRIYEHGGPVLETEDTLSRRTGMTRRKVRDALAWLIGCGKIALAENGRIDSDTTHDELAYQQKRSQQATENALGGAQKPKPKKQEKSTKPSRDRIAIATESESEKESLSSKVEPVPRAEPTTDDRRSPNEIFEKLVEAAGGNVADTEGGNVIAPVLALLRQGCDLELDVLPVVRERIATLSEPLRTWKAKWLREAILAARDGRLAASCASARPPPDPASARRAQVTQAKGLWGMGIRKGFQIPDDVWREVGEICQREAQERRAKAPAVRPGKLNGTASTPHH